MEHENDNMIPFLDMLVIRTTSNQIITNWYSKPTSADNILNYLSAHPYHQKINVASNLAKRILLLSDRKFHTDNIDKIYNILLKNNYPLNIIKKIIHKTRDQLQYNHSQQQQDNIQSTQSTNYISMNQQQQQQHQEQQEQEQRLRQTVETEAVVEQGTEPSIPPLDPSVNTNEQNNSNFYYTPLTYIPQLSDNIRQLVKNSDCNSKIAFKSTKTIKNNIFANMKQKVHNLKQSSVVYKIDCAEENCGISYLGETKRQLEVRKIEHERSYRTRFTPSPKTGLINHCLDTGHTFDFENINIVDKETNKDKRRMIESAHIILNSPKTCNFKQDTNNIHNNYNNTLRIYKSISPKFKK